MPPEPPMPPESELSRERREHILASACALAGRDGLAGLSEQALAAADVDPQAIDYYFGSLTNLIVETLRELRFRRHERYGQMLANLPAVGSSVADWNGSARAVARGLIWVGGDDPYKLWDLLDQAARCPELAAEAEASLTAVQESVGQLMLEAGVPRGELLGRPLIALEFGLITHRRICPCGEDELVDDLSHGLLALINGHQALVGGQVPGT